MKLSMQIVLAALLLAFVVGMMLFHADRCYFYNGGLVETPCKTGGLRASFKP